MKKYACNKCGTAVNIIMIPRVVTVTCPKCGDPMVEKQLGEKRSLLAFSTKSRSAPRKR